MKEKLFCVLTMSLLATAAMAVPARRDWMVLTQPDGTEIRVRQTGDEFYHYWENEQGQVVQPKENGFWDVVEEAPSSETVAARRAASPMQQHGNRRVGAGQNLAPRGLFILANFTDKAFQEENDNEGMNEMMNGENYDYEGAVGSAKQYFIDQSDGQYVPVFDVYGPVTVNSKCSYYGHNSWTGNDSNPGDLIVEACQRVDEEYDVDFSIYDNDEDGYIDFVYVIYAGKGEADGGGSETIWPHNWVIMPNYNTKYSGSSLVFDGKTLSNYACSGELNGRSGNRNGIGTLVHEFGHVIGLPDFYDTNYGTNYKKSLTPGEWDVMDGGSYNGDGKCPPNYSPWEKYFFGWATPKVLNTAGEVVLTTDYYDICQLNAQQELAPYDATATQYYLDNRQQRGWDASLPGHGMLVWQVKYNQSQWGSNSPNNTANSPRYTIIPSTGAPTVSCDQKDPFPGEDNIMDCEVLKDLPLINIEERADSSIRMDFIEVVDPYHWNYKVISEHAETESQRGVVLRDSALVLAIHPDWGYRIDSADHLSVTMDSIGLEYGKDFTYQRDTLTIPSVTGRVIVRVTPALRDFTVTMVQDEVVSDTIVPFGKFIYLPTGEDCECGRVFAGWSVRYMAQVTDTLPSLLTSLSVTRDTTLYAVYATPYDFPGDSSKVGQIVWMEDWSGYSADEKPNAFEYATSGSTTKISDSEHAGGESAPELALAKNNGALTINALETQGAEQIELTFASDKSNLKVSSLTTGITISGSGKEWTVSNPRHLNTVKLKIMSNNTSVAYIDDILMVVKQYIAPGTSYSNYGGMCDLPSGVERTDAVPSASQWQKELQNGRIVLVAPDGKTYTILGQ